MCINDTNYVKNEACSHNDINNKRHDNNCYKIFYEKCINNTDNIEDLDVNNINFL